MKLNNSIGIDKTILCRFSLVELDEKKLRKQEELATKNNLGAKAIQIVIGESNNSLVEGHNIDRITIHDKVYGLFDIRKRKRDEIYHVQAKISLIIGNGGNNAYSLRAREYKQLVSDMEQHFWKNYGIAIDSDTMVISQIELNGTFFLDEDFMCYSDAIRLIMANIPQVTVGKNNKILSWVAVESQTAKLKLETTVFKNNCTQLKIYDKYQQLVDTGVPIVLEKGLMRVEYTFKDMDTIQRHLETNKVDELTDGAICAMFGYFWKRDVVKPYETWKKENQKMLNEKVLQHMKTEGRHWFDAFIREMRQYEKLHAYPILFDLEDMKPAIKFAMKTLKKDVSNAGRVYRTFVKRAFWEHDLSGNNKKMKEILSKVDTLVNERYDSHISDEPFEQKNH